MATHGKKYRNVQGKVEDRQYALDEAIAFVKANAFAKFDETMELSARLGVDPAKTDQTVRGTVSLPNGTGKSVRVIVFASGAAADAARSAGADVVGFEDLMEKVKGGWLDFDIAVATPDAMKEVKKLGKMLGPRGLMPNPKTGTVSEDTAGAVKQCKAGRVEYRMDKNGNVQVPFGKVSFDVSKLVENARAVMDAIKADKPSSVKGIYIKKWTVGSTMGVGLPLNERD